MADGDDSAGDDDQRRRAASGAHPEGGERQRPAAARPGYEQLWRFFRGWTGLLVVGWTLVGLVAPPDPVLGAGLVVASGVAAAPAAWWLVYRDGYDRLRDSPHYRPGVPAARTVVTAVVVAVLAKVVGTAVVDAWLAAQPGYVEVDPRTLPTNGTATATPEVLADGTAVRDRSYVYDLAVSLVAVATAYLLVVRGWLAWLAGVER